MNDTHNDTTSDKDWVVYHDRKYREQVLDIKRRSKSKLTLHGFADKALEKGIEILSKKTTLDTTVTTAN